MALQLRRGHGQHDISRNSHSSTSSEASTEKAEHIINGQTHVIDGESSNAAELQRVLLYLARCPERSLMLITLAVRVLLLMTMLFAHRVLPRLVGMPSLSFDTCETLYEDGRFTEVRNWDTVHFYHIAQYGYTHENLFAFFPLVPLLIRAVMWLTQRALPWLGRLVPVSFYMCAINIAASCVAGVVLRRLTRLTFDATEGNTSDAIEVEDSNNSNEGTRLDCFPCLARSYYFTITGAAASPAERKRTRDRRQCVVGGALLLWIVTPAMVFSVAVYTESLFSLFTFIGIYCLAKGTHTGRNEIGNNSNSVATRAALLTIDEGSVITTKSTSALSESGCVSKLSESIPDTIVSNEEGNICSKEGIVSEGQLPPPLSPHTTTTNSNSSSSSDGQPHVSYLVHAIPPPPCTSTPTLHTETPRTVSSPSVQQLPSRHELLAMLCFMVASGIRSNAFLCIGFVLYPAFLQMCFPVEYARRTRTTTTTRAAAQHGSAPRWPGVLRLFVLFCESALIAMPYMLMNYLGWHRFAPMWPAEERARLRGVHFWSFYRIVQRKYWNVNLLSSYNWANSPNILIALPVAVEVTLTMYRFYFRPIYAQWREEHHNNNAKDRMRRGSALRAQLKSCYSLIGLLVQSCNMVYLLVLCLIAFSVMHIQVSNRFLMSCPALYWLWGCQLALYPAHWLTRFTLTCSLGWAITGALLFPNHMPWT